MTLTLDPVTEQRLHQELATGQYREPNQLIAHALDLVRDEREQMEDWLTRNREAIIADLEETDAQAARGEGYAPEEAKAMLAEHRAARVAQAA